MVKGPPPSEEDRRILRREKNRQLQDYVKKNPVPLTDSTAKMVKMVKDPRMQEIARKTAQMFPDSGGGSSLHRGSERVKQWMEKDPKNKGKSFEVNY